MDIETFKYEKIITINDPTIIKDMMNLLINFMYEDATKKGESVQYFRLRLKDPEEGMSYRDLKLEWVTCVLE